MLLNVLFLLLIPVMGERRPFRCNSKDEVEDLRIRQVIMMAGRVYLYREKQLIRFNAPFCFYDLENRTVCALSQAFEEENNFPSLENKIKKLKGR